MKRIFVTALLFCFATTAQAFSTEEARACVQAGVNQAQQTGDLQSFIDTRVDIDGLAELAAWRAWRTGWDQVTMEQKNTALATARDYLADTDALSDIDRTTIMLDRFGSESNLSDGSIRVYGSFDTTRGRTEKFSIRVTSGCYVIDAEWQNVILSNRIAARM